MAASVQQKADLPYNRAVLRWARERRSYTLDETAKRVGTSPDNVRAWESGEAKPTVRQARVLADFYGRSFLEFFRDEPPPLVESDLVPDYRLHRGAPEPVESRDLLDIQAWAEEVRLNAIDLYDILGDRPPSVPDRVRSSLAESPEVAAVRAREAIGFRHQDQIALDRKRRDQVTKTLRLKLEASGILVLKESGLARFHARGLCIFADPFPVIVFSAEANSAQLFTIAHEFGHVALGQSAISGPPPARGAASHARRVEQWCNSFAAAFLVPAADLQNLRPRPLQPAAGIADAELTTLANRYAVSRHAMLLRLIELRYVADRFYWDEKRNEFLEAEQNYRSGGRSEYYGSRYRSSRGDLYTSLVLEAWNAGRITNHNAGEFMGIKNLRHLDDIRDRFGG